MKYYVTLTGLNYRFGTQPFAVGQKVKLVKEPENDFDHEAIRAELPGLGNFPPPPVLGTFQRSPTIKHRGLNKKDVSACE